MKRLFYLVMIITLPLIAFFQFDRYRRFHPPTDYEYPLNSGIDATYHDPTLVLKYHTTAHQIGTYAKHCWRKWKLDVHSVNPTDPRYAEQLMTYQQYLATTQQLEGRLLQSASWKAEGYSNAEIQQLEEGKTLTTEQFVESLINNPILAKVGDRGPLVYEIQRALRKRSYDLPWDGIYRSETERDVRNFQEKQQLFPSGVVDKQTLLRLLTD